MLFNSVSTINITAFIISGINVGKLCAIPLTNSTNIVIPICNIEGKLSVITFIIIWITWSVLLIIFGRFSCNPTIIVSIVELINSTNFGASAISLLIKLGTSATIVSVIV